MPVRRSRFIMGLTASSALAGLPQFAAAQSDATLRVGTVLVQLYGAPYFADEAGSFRKAGFETAITSVNNGPQVAAALAGGSA
jgi:ABC-type nitrate/sulfonate/bicarbonate transport system substrate-binding protein